MNAIQLYSSFNVILITDQITQYLYLKENIPGYVCNHGSPREWDAASNAMGDAISDIQLWIICVITRYRTTCGDLSGLVDRGQGGYPWPLLNRWGMHQSLALRSDKELPAAGLETKNKGFLHMSKARSDPKTRPDKRFSVLEKHTFLTLSLNPNSFMGRTRY